MLPQDLWEPQRDEGAGKGKRKIRYVDRDKRPVPALISGIGWVLLSCSSRVTEDLAIGPGRTEIEYCFDGGYGRRVLSLSFKDRDDREPPIWKEYSLATEDVTVLVIVQSGSEDSQMGLSK